MNDHDHDEDGNCILPEGVAYVQQQPSWKFSLWDMAGIGVATIGGFFGVVNQAANMVSQHCAAMANWTRANYDAEQLQAQHEAEVERYEQHQLEMAEYLHALVEGDEGYEEEEEL